MLEAFLSNPHPPTAHILTEWFLGLDGLSRLQRSLCLRAVGSGFGFGLLVLGWQFRRFVGCCSMWPAGLFSGLWPLVSIFCMEVGQTYSCQARSLSFRRKMG